MGKVKLLDVIEIVESHYVPDLPIGNKYVVIGLMDDVGDVEIINENGEYDIVCWEDYKVIGNFKDLKDDYWNQVIVKQME